MDGDKKSLLAATRQAKLVKLYKLYSNTLTLILLVHIGIVLALAFTGKVREQPVAFVISMLTLMVVALVFTE